VTKCKFGSLEKLCNVHKRGSSSFNMHNSEKVFKEFDIKHGDIVLDLGCGPGDYVIEAAKRAGSSGLVYALDIKKELLDDLDNRAIQEDLKNIKTIACDITEKLPIPDRCIDLCIIVTVLHITEISKRIDCLLSETNRVLKGGGKLITIDVKKECESFGPPINMRLMPEELESTMKKNRFGKIKMIDLGYNYMMQFGKN
jgi:ubiquinone/menaquinone biosynthesis C-methylase UbiE